MTWKEKFKGLDHRWADSVVIWFIENEIIKKIIEDIPDYPSPQLKEELNKKWL